MNRPLRQGFPDKEVKGRTTVISDDLSDLESFRKNLGTNRDGGRSDSKQVAADANPVRKAGPYT